MKRSICFTAVMGSLAVLLAGAALSGCAEKKTRLWIEPPAGTEVSERNQQKLYYQVEDTQSGKKENLMIPLQQMPENLVVEQKGSQHPEDALAPVTKADREIADGKLPAAGKLAAPTVSYLRGLNEVESLYQKQQYSEALVHLAPLLEQYPKQARLFTMQGTLYRKIGEKKLALDAYKQAQSLDKGDPAVEDAVLRAKDEAGETL